MAEFQVSDGPLRQLAHDRRFAAELAGLVWQRLLTSGSIVAADPERFDVGKIFVAEFDKGYRSHVQDWQDAHVDDLEALMATLAQELAKLLDELAGQGGRMHGGG